MKRMRGGFAGKGIPGQLAIAVGVGTVPLTTCCGVSRGGEGKKERKRGGEKGRGVVSCSFGKATLPPSLPPILACVAKKRRGRRAAL